jgi:hypothetical protein
MKKKMTNDPHNGIDADALADSHVELTAPDGTVYRFRYGAVLPYAGQEYVVLVELENDPNGEEQLLITRLIESEEGELSFEVVTEDDIIQAILQKYTEKQIHDVMEEDEGGCCCGHEHQDGCGCHVNSNEHQDSCCGHDHSHKHQDGCCGCSH